MHPWRLGFGSVVMAVSAVTWMSRAPVPPGAGARALAFAGQPRAQRISTSAARCAVPSPADAPDRAAVPDLSPLQPQRLQPRTVVLVDSPVALAGGQARVR